MNSICRTWCAALMLAAIAGCDAGVETPVDTMPSASPTPTTTGTASDTATPPSGGMKAEMQAAPAPDAPAGDAAPKADAPAVDAPKDGAPQAAAVSLSEEEIAEIKTLPAAEQPLALKQLVCPVSEENLGSMGKPIKMEAKGQTFFLCCSGCEKSVKSDPDAVLAKLKK
jgi:hypothetical protein